MASSINSIVISGNLGNEPEFNVTPNGTPVAKLSVAVSDYDYSAKAAKTMWVRVTCFGSLAERVEKYLSKGAKVGVTGRLSIRDYTDKEGTKRTATEVVANDIAFLSPKPDGNVKSRKSSEDEIDLDPWLDS